LLLCYEASQVLPATKPIEKFQLLALYKLVINGQQTMMPATGTDKRNFLCYHGNNQNINRGKLVLIPPNGVTKRQKVLQGYLIYQVANADCFDEWQSEVMPSDKFHPVSFCC